MDMPINLEHKTISNIDIVRSIESHNWFSLAHFQLVPHSDRISHPHRHLLNFGQTRLKLGTPQKFQPLPNDDFIIRLDFSILELIKVSCLSG
jgi:hypothetical protein